MSPAAPPPVGRLAGIAYEGMVPVAMGDAERGYPLLKFLHAYYLPLQQIDDIVREPILWDPDLCPFRYLPWLAMWAGVRLRPGMPEAEIRSRIKLRDGRKRCTPDALVAAAKANLDADSPIVILRERHNPDNPLVDSAAHFEVLTYTAQTPDEGAVRAAMLEHKDVGLIMHYRVVDGQDWQQVVNTYATWQDVLDNYATWQDLIEDTPA